MKDLLIMAGLLVLASSCANAESLRPEEVVTALVNAAHQNNLKGVLDTANLVEIAKQKRHGRSPKNLVKFLKGIDPKKLKFQEIKRKGWPKTAIVRIIAPISMDFDLELVKATKEKQEDHYRVVAVPGSDLTATWQDLRSGDPTKAQEAMRLIQTKLTAGMSEEEVLRLFPPGALNKTSTSVDPKEEWLVLEPELKKKVFHYQSSAFHVILDQDGTVKRSVLNIIVEF